MDDTLAKLEAEYCPPLDPALLSAILLDYDLTVESGVQDARAILDPLKEHALSEEELGFDASGTGARDEGLTFATRPESCPETSESLSRETDLTSLSNDLSSFDFEGGPGEDSSTSASNTTAEELENLDEDTKIQLLQEIFQDRVSRYNAQHTLRKCHGKWHNAMEELLNHVYFDENGQADSEDKVQAKGVDAFSEDNIARRGRKKKPKGKALKLIDERRSSSLPVSPVDSPAPPSNRWQTSSQDVEFIAERTGIATASISSIYYANGASISKTIGHVLKDSIRKDGADLSDDPILAVNAHELGTDFPMIAEDYVRALVRLTHPSTAAAHELAKALSSKPPSPTGGIQIIPTYTRPTEDEPIDSSWRTVQKKTASTKSGFSPIDGPNASERAAAYSAARSAALSQAYAAHKKAKSDRLMGGAAAYYSQVGRDLATLSSHASAAAADELAAAQSGPSQLDLHGIDVLNAVRIAREKVDQWWDHLGESRANGRLGAEARQAGYNIIVGLGRHSEGGRGKLGPAVSKSLREGGWKVEQAGAIIVVKGRSRGR